jgi:hypothetical protein
LVSRLSKSWETILIDKHITGSSRTDRGDARA